MRKSKKKLYSLVDHPEHMAKLAEVRDEWIANALSTAAMTEEDRAACRRAVRGMYEAAGFAPPPDHRIIFVSSPFAARFAGGAAAWTWYCRKNRAKLATRDATSAAIREATRDATGEATYDATYEAIDDATYEATDEATRAAIYAATDAVTRDATDAATRDATRDATDAAIRDATSEAARDAIRDAIRAATYDATYDATSEATHAATRDAIRAATYDATYEATRDATSAAIHEAIHAATRDATYEATRDATRDAIRAATYEATSAATRAATRDATDAATLAATRDATYEATYGATRDATEAATRAATSATTDEAASDLLWYSFHGDISWASPEQRVCAEGAWRMLQGGNQWSGWDSYINFFRRVATLDIDYSSWEHWETLSRRSGPRIVHEQFCIISDRPETLTVDDRGRPHNATGPYCRWRDGSALYAIHGVRVPRYVVEHPERITVERIREEQNVEVRRIMVERYGVGRYLSEIGAEVVDMDTLTLPGSAPRCLMRDDTGTKWLIGTDGSTRRVYSMAVPPEAMTCAEAHRMIGGFQSESDCLFEC